MARLRPRRPLAVPCAAFALGAWAGGSGVGGGAWPLVAALAAGCAAVAAAVAAPRLRRAAPAAGAAIPAAFAAIFFFAVAFAISRADARRRLDAVQALRETIEERADAVVSGRVVSEPAATALPHGGARLRFDMDVFSVPAELGSVQTSPTRIRVDWYGPESMASDRPPFRLPRAGEGWCVGGALKEVPTRSAVPFLVLSRRPGQGVARREPTLDAPAPVAALWRLRQSGSRAIEAALGGRRAEAGVIRAMVLGERSNLEPETEALFKDSGTVHVFAISGLHVAIFATALAWALSRLGFSWRGVAVPLLPAIAAYVVMTGAHASAIRSGVMLSFVYAARLLGRRSDGPTALCASAFAILAVAPLQIVDPGFVFSFACTAAILAFGGDPDAADAAGADVPGLQSEIGSDGLPLPMAERALSRKIARGDASFAERARARAAAWLERGRLSLRRSARISVVAWLVSAPLTAMYFGRLAPVAMLCNLVVVPLAEIVVRASLGVLALAALAPAAAPVAGWACALPVRLMVWCARLGSAVPGATFQTRPWPPAAVAAWYAALAAFVVLRRFGGRRNASLDWIP